MAASVIAAQLGLEPDQVIIGGAEQPRLVAEKLAKVDGPLVIALDGTFPSGRSSTYPGMELLTWLRLKHKHTAPILLVGFQTAEEILAKHPEHLIMLAPGNRYERLPLAPERVLGIVQWLFERNELEKRSATGGYRPFVLPAYDEARFKHRLANLWGIQRLCAVHERVTGTGLELGADTEPPLEFFMLQRLLDNATDGSDDWIQEARRARTRLGNRLQESRLKVLLIDDQAFDGWADLYAAMLFDDPYDQRLQQLPLSNAKLQDRDTYFKEELILEIKKRQTDLILLDLRLSDEDHGANVKDLSGVRLMEQIRTVDPAVPIIVTTASARAESLDHLRHLGCDAYWVKEDVSSPSGLERAGQSYTNLLELVLGTMDPLWDEARQFGRHIVELEGAKAQHWWEKERPDVKGTDRYVFIGIMHESLFLLRDYLGMTTLGARMEPAVNKWFYPSLIMQHLSKLIEVVHGSSQREYLLEVDELGSELFIGRNSASHLVKLSSIPHISTIDDAKLIEWLSKFREWTVKLRVPKKVHTVKDTGIRIDVSDYKRPPKRDGHGKGND
ncbi:MAG TPA: response regulator [Flavobacteriales bacterium]|nr:response regulator [Flavobacteriales bacterium]HMR28796.1 response regulator [Flavobacteriales bacterium]